MNRIKIKETHWGKTGIKPCHILGKNYFTNGEPFEKPSQFQFRPVRVNFISYMFI